MEVKKGVKIMTQEKTPKNADKTNDRFFIYRCNRGYGMSMYHIKKMMKEVEE